MHGGVATQHRALSINHHEPVPVASTRQRPKTKDHRRQVTDPRKQTRRHIKHFLTADHIPHHTPHHQASYDRRATLPLDTCLPGKRAAGHHPPSMRRSQSPGLDKLRQCWRKIDRDHRLSMRMGRPASLFDHCRPAREVMFSL